MYWLINWFESTRDFMELGGWVLSVIALVLFLMWLLIIERLIFFGTGLRAAIAAARNRWESRAERKSWNAKQIRDAIISRVSEDANAYLPLIQTLVALCPLLGLLGTVTGMIEVFEVMAVSGTGNARSMAAGVSKATIPTMAGMVGALSGVFAVTFLNRKAARDVERLRDSLTMDH